MCCAVPMTALWVHRGIRPYEKSVYQRDIFCGIQADLSATPFFTMRYD